ncbi:MAG: homoserine O-succinyltransferase [Clostridia bacterium]|nr:homoserine O-succinyltransferase [Clostridia bacterium]
MPIKINEHLPAAQVLKNENIFVITESRATSQDIRPLRILILNLMPTKIVTETQLARLLGNTPLQIEMELLAVGRTPKNTTKEHMLAFYKSFADVKDRFYDGMVITGAPVEHLPFEEVDYWEELCAIMEWSKTHVYSTFHICWGAQAALYYHYGINKVPLPEKMFGVFRHKVTHHGSILFRGFDDTFMVPHSRHTTVRREDIAAEPRLKILSESEEAGVYAVSTHGGRQIFITGHSEYDPETLGLEYKRDKNAGLPIRVPVNYYPDDDDTKEPVSTWRSGANLLYSNWLNYFVYQSTPYDIDTLAELALHLPDQP